MATRGPADARCKAEMHAITHPHPTTLRCDQPSSESLADLLRNNSLEEGRKHVEVN